VNILIADDEAPKLENLSGVLTRVFPQSSIFHARSVRAALDELRSRETHLLVLDMSLPTFDVAPGEPGGRPQGFGGIEVLRRMKFYGVDCPALVVTQYEAFPRSDGVVDLTALQGQLQDEFGEQFIGCIYYGAASGSWALNVEVALAAFDAGSSK
jgi:CheY-like chemotaxis protein